MHYYFFVISIIINLIESNDLGNTTVTDTNKISINDYSEDDDTLSRRVVGGFFAKNRQFPFIAELYTDRHLCGGAIISNRWILSAAHCTVIVEIEDLSIVLGLIRLRDKKRRILKPLKVFDHPHYDKIFDGNDISLIKTVETIEFNDKVQSIGLANFNLDGSYDVTIIGWGRTNVQNEKSSNRLKYFNTTTISNQNCKDIKGYPVKHHLCTLSPIGLGICFGDSGGPLIHNNRIHGVVSMSKPCALGSPDVFTNVYYFLGWIETITGIQP